MFNTVTHVWSRGEVVNPRALTVQGVDVVNPIMESVKYQRFFLYSASIRPGNSGGPIVAQDGCVIGIVAHTKFDNGDREGGPEFYRVIAGSVVVDWLVSWRTGSTTRASNSPGVHTSLPQPLYGGDMAERNVERQLAETYRLHREAQLAEERAWRPTASSMEALVLKVLGGWEMLKADVNWAYYHSAGPGAPPAKKHGLPAKMNQVAMANNVRWPHDDWSAACDRANKMRQKLAHLLHVYKVDNDSRPPNRKLAFMRLGTPGEPRIVDGQPGELSFGDDVWSQRNQHIDAVTEEELANTLWDIKWLVDCVHFLKRLGDLLSGDNPWSEDYELPRWERDMLVWWFPDWGDPETAVVRAGQLRVKPFGGS